MREKLPENARKSIPIQKINIHRPAMLVTASVNIRLQNRLHSIIIASLNENLSAKVPHMILPPALHTAANVPTAARNTSSVINVCPYALYNEEIKLDPCPLSKKISHSI